jgi:hypothetical protein
MPELEEVNDEDDVSVILQQRRNNPKWPDLNAEVEQLVRTESRPRRDNDGFIPIGANHWGFTFDQMREIIEFTQEGNIVEVGVFVMDNAAEDDVSAMVDQELAKWNTQSSAWNQHAESFSAEE